MGRIVCKIRHGVKYERIPYLYSFDKAQIKSVIKAEMRHRNMIRISMEHHVKCLILISFLLIQND